MEVYHAGSVSSDSVPGGTCVCILTSSTPRERTISAGHARSDLARRTICRGTSRWCTEKSDHLSAASASEHFRQRAASSDTNIHTSCRSDTLASQRRTQFSQHSSLPHTHTHTLQLFIIYNMPLPPAHLHILCLPTIFIKSTKH